MAIVDIKHTQTIEEALGKMGSGGSNEATGTLMKIGHTAPVKVSVDTNAMGSDAPAILSEDWIIFDDAFKDSSVYKKIFNDPDHRNSGNAKIYFLNDLPLHVDGSLYGIMEFPYPIITFRDGAGGTLIGEEGEIPKLAAMIPQDSTDLKFTLVSGKLSDTIGAGTVEVEVPSIDVYCPTPASYMMNIL